MKIEVNSKGLIVNSEQRRVNGEGLIVNGY